MNLAAQGGSSSVRTIMLRTSGLGEKERGEWR